MNAVWTVVTLMHIRDSTRETAPVKPALEHVKRL